MSRIRSVHPGFFKDERLVACSAFARLLFIGIGVEADDKGVFEWKPLTLKMTVFPADNIDVPALLAELEAADAVRRYEVGGRHYGAIRNFRKFQKPKTPNDVHPASDEVRKYVGLTAAVSEGSEDDEPSFPLKGEKGAQMEDGGGKEEEEKNISLDAERDFEDWYASYPRHVGKGAARKAYRAARKKADVRTLTDGALRAQAEYMGKDPQFIPHPSSWLNAERWDDQAPPKRNWRDDPEMRGVI